MTSQWSIHYLQPDLQVTYTPQSESHSVVSDSFRPYGLYSPWNSPGQNTGVGSCFLLQGIFPTQGLNPDLQHCRQILYQLSHKGSPGILQWVAYPFSSRSSSPRNRTGVSCIAGGFFTNWATREALHPTKPDGLLSSKPFIQGLPRHSSLACSSHLLLQCPSISITSPFQRSASLRLLSPTCYRFLWLTFITISATHNSMPCHIFSSAETTHTCIHCSLRRKTNTIWYHLYVESKLWHKWTCLWNRNWLRDTENRLVVTKGEKEGEGWIGSLGSADANYYL